MRFVVDRMSWRIQVNHSKVVDVKLAIPWFNQAVP